MVRVKTRYAALFLSVSLTVAVLAAHSREQQRPPLNTLAYGNIKTDFPGRDDADNKPAVPMSGIRPVPHPTPIKPPDWIHLPAHEFVVITTPESWHPEDTKMQAFALQLTLTPVSGQTPRASARLVPTRLVSVTPTSAGTTGRSQGYKVTSLKTTPGTDMVVVTATTMAANAEPSGAAAKPEMQMMSAFLLSR